MRSLTNHVPLRFLVSGAFVASVVYVVFVSMGYFRWHYAIASTAAWAVGLLTSYFVNRGFTFDMGVDASLPEFLKFFASNVFQLAIGITGYYVLIDKLGLGWSVAYVLNSALTAVIGYVLMSAIVFPRSRRRTDGNPQDQREVEAMPQSEKGPGSTIGSDYTERLERLSNKRWKSVLDVQAPYRWNIRRLGLGRTLDLGCGIGRHLANMDAGSVGIDHNSASLAICHKKGLTAYTPEEFAAAFGDTAPFDSILAAHLFEHLSQTDAEALLSQYVRYIKPGGRVVIITPQERGYGSDATHVTFVDFANAERLCRAAKLSVVKQYSFPMPRAMGKVFTHNEFVTVAQKAR